MSKERRQREFIGRISNCERRKGDQDTLVGFDDVLGHYQNKNPQLDRVLTMVRGHCAIGMESKIAEDGRQALVHTRAERMVVYNLGEKDIQTVRVILVSYGIYAANMMDIDAMGISDPEGHFRHIDDWRSNDGRTGPKAAAWCSVWVFEDQASHRNITYEIDPLGAWEKIAEAHRL